MLEEQQSLKEKEKKKVTNLPDEEQSRQRRSVFLLRTVPVSLDATAGVSTNDEEKGTAGVKVRAPHNLQIASHSAWCEKLSEVLVSEVTPGKREF